MNIGLANGGVARIFRGTYGPRHDPYSFTEIVVEKNGTTHKCHMGLGSWYEVDGVRVERDGWNYSDLFAEGTGFQPYEWEDFFDMRDRARYRAMTKQQRREYDACREADYALMRYAV
jgi:hypothetical protein